MPTRQLQLIYRRQRISILAALKEIQGGEIVNPNYGICDNVFSMSGEKPEFLFEKYYDQWPHFSGRHIYPVPHPHKRPHIAYLIAGVEEMWDKNTDYGYYRWNLVEFLINKIEEDLNNG